MWRPFTRFSVFSISLEEAMYYIVYSIGKHPYEYLVICALTIVLGTFWSSQLLWGIVLQVNSVVMVTVN